MKTTKLQVLGITCDNCANTIVNAMAELGAAASVDLASSEVVVRHGEGQPGLGTETMVEAIYEAFKPKGKAVAVSVIDEG